MIEPEHEPKVVSPEHDPLFIKAAFDSLPGVFYLINEQRRFVRWNHNLEQVTEYSAAEIAAMRPLDFFLGADKQLIGDRIQEVFERGHATAEAELVSKSGRHTPYYFTGLRVVLGETRYLVGMGIDLSERRRAEAALNAFETRYRHLFENVPIGIYRISPDGRILMANPTLIRMLGYQSFEELAAHNSEQEGWGFHYPPSRFKELVELTGEVRGLEVIWRRRDQSSVFVRENATAVRADDGTVLYYEGTAEDITEWKQAETALRQSEDRYRDLVEHSGLLIGTHDLQGNILSVNRSVVEQAGFAHAEEIVGLKLSDFLTPEVRYLFPAYLAQLQGTGRAQGLMKIRLPNGRERTLEYNNTLRREGLAAPVVRCIGRDVTERRRAEERIREQATLLNRAYEAIFVLDLEGRFVYWNKGAERMLGWTTAEMLGRFARETLFQDAANTFADAQRKAREQGSWEGELLRRTKDGTEIIVESRWTLVRNERGEPRSILVVSSDITEKKRLAAELARAAQLALIGKFAAGLAHEIKNPLAGIQGVVDNFLRQRTTDDPEREELEAIRREVAYIDARVRALLDHARPRAFDVAPVSLTEVVRRAVLLGRRQAALAAAKGRKISIEFEALAGQIVVAIDAAQIEDAVLNLVLNAVESIPVAGRVTVRVRLDDQDQTGAPQVAVVEVEDTGAGVAEENRLSIFNPFFTTKLGGTGLGLSAVRWTADAYGGRVELVRTEVGRGSTFALLLPLSPRGIYR